MLSIDLNCDMGEGCGNDAALMKYVSSANIACGFHAGDRTTMGETVELALERDVAIGAHPGYRDPENFGREPMSLSTDEVFEIVAEQINILRQICVELGARLHHIKPHGALYNQAARNGELASAIAKAVLSVDPTLVLYGLSGSFLISEANAAGLRTASEVFADRTYRSDGFLTPRTESNSLITGVDGAISQVVQMVETQTVSATTGEKVPIAAETICIHGDGVHAVKFARSIHDALMRRSITVSAQDAKACA